MIGGEDSTQAARIDNDFNTGNSDQAQGAVLVLSDRGIEFRVCRMASDATHKDLYEIQVAETDVTRFSALASLPPAMDRKLPSRVLRRLLSVLF